MNKFRRVYNTVSRLPSRSYSGKIKSYLISEGLIRMRGNEIEINDVNKIVDSLHDYLSAKEVLGDAFA